jgi:Fe-S-cluster containining protein
MTVSANVPCNGCTACCQTDLIFIHPEMGDDPNLYDVAPAFNPLTNESGMALKHKPGGGCVYVTDKGCGIHGHQPAVCREFDCRKLYRQLFSIPRPERRRLQKKLNKNHLLAPAVIEAARARLHTLPG